MAKAYLVTRFLKTPAFWGTEVLRPGDVVYATNRPTYGCCASWELPVTLKSDGDYPFLGIPHEALERREALDT